MTIYTGTSPIVGPSTPIDLDKLIAWVVAQGAQRVDHLDGYFVTIRQGCKVLGFDEVVLCAQWDNETDTGRSQWWKNGLNPAGLGITGDPAQNAAAQTWESGEEAAQAHLSHMMAYVYGDDRTRWPTTWPAPNVINKRYSLVPRTGTKKPARTLSDLNGTWAIDPQNNYHGKLAGRANRIVAVAGTSDTQPTPLPTPTPQPSTRTFGQWLDLLFGKGWRITQDWAARGGPNLYAYGKGHGLDGSQHTGVDVGIPYGTRMYAPAPGKIVCAGTGIGSGAPGGGCSAYRDFGNDNETGTIKGIGRIEIYYPALNASLIYGHSRTAAVKPGDMVQAGQLIGTSGGMNGPHIHLEYIQWGTAQGYTLFDPRVLLAKFGGSPAPPAEGPSMVTTGRVPHPAHEKYHVRKDPGHGHRIGTRRPRGCVHHEWMDGGEMGEAFYKKFFECPNGDRHAAALVDYVILRSGKIIMLNDPRGNRIPYASGGSGPYEGDGGAYAGKFGVASVNADLVSWEYAKRDTDNYTPAQIQAGGALAAYWHDQDGQRWDEHPYTSKYGLVTSFLHYELGATSCGRGELDDISKVQAVTKAIMKQYQTQAAPAPQPQPQPQPTPTTQPPITPIPPDVPPLPEPALPGGKPEEWWRDALGPLFRWKGGIWTGPHYFDTNGVISLAYAHRAWNEQTFPKATAWYVLPERDVAPEDRQQIVQFSNSWELRFLNERAGWLWSDLEPPAVIVEKG